MNQPGGTEPCSEPDVAVAGAAGVRPKADDARMRLPARIEGALALVPDPPPPSGLAVDLSAGDGRASAALAARGWRVVSTELRPARPGWVAADLGAPFFPFRTGVFDLVLMLEVIEHLENSAHTLREVARILKPGGIAIVSTPNRLNMSSRIHYLLTGFYKGRRAPLPYTYGPADGRNWHVLGLNDLDWLANAAGLEIEALGRSRYKMRSLLYGAFFYLPIWLFSHLVYVASVRDDRQRRINRRLHRMMTSAPLLLDENLIIKLRLRA